MNNLVLCPRNFDTTAKGIRYSGVTELLYALKDSAMGMIGGMSRLNNVDTSNMNTERKLIYEGLMLKVDQNGFHHNRNLLIDNINDYNNAKEFYDNYER
jgi:hypothetical protein